MSWLERNCQSNSWVNVYPDPSKSCGPYTPIKENAEKHPIKSTSHNHDTIGTISIDDDKNIVISVTTNGKNHKIPGRVGDSPIPGSGGYAENGVGGCVATGDGDEMLRFSPTFACVQAMKDGATAQKAAEIAIQNIKRYYDFNGAVLAVKADETYGAACSGDFSNGSSGRPDFTFGLRTNDSTPAQLMTRECDKFDDSTSHSERLIGFGLLIVLGFLL